MQRNEGFKGIAALIEPIAALVGNDLFEVVAQNGSHISDGGKLLFFGKVVADLRVENFCGALVRLFNKNGDGDGRARALPENTLTLLALKFAHCPFIAAQIININLSELVLKSFAQAVHSRAVKPSGVGDETDNAFGADSVTRQAERLDVAVVERIFIGSVGFLGVGCGDTRLKVLVELILSVVVGGALPDGIGRVADDNFNARNFLIVDALEIFFQNALKTEPLLDVLVKLESIGKTNALKGLIILRVDGGVKRILDIYGGDVVSKQDKLVGVEFQDGEKFRRDWSWLEMSGLRSGFHPYLYFY